MLQLGRITSATIENENGEGHEVPSPAFKKREALEAERSFRKLTPDQLPPSDGFR
jgi:hypothetical protein